MFATNARGSCSVDPGPVPLKMVIFSVSPIGDWLYGVRKIEAFVHLMFSTSAMQPFTALTVLGGGTDLALMRPRKGSPAAIGVFKFEGIALPSA